MRLARIASDGREGIALADGDSARALFDTDAGYPGGLPELVSAGSQALQRAAEVLATAEPVALESVSYLPLLGQTGKIICVGINYPGHARETHYDVPPHPTIFARFPTSLTGHKAPLVRPWVSEQLDYEGELVAVIGKGGRHIAEDGALAHVIGYSIFNDGSVRDFQMETPQWTVGKNFDSTGAFGPFLVTADELPAGGSGLQLTTRLNGQIVQHANTSEMIYGVANVIAFLSEAMTFHPGDALVMGTPPGVGLERDPQLFMKAGDVCEVEIEGIGLLSNPIVDEALPVSSQHAAG
jgi:2-keto-4-pentenoate hydratase/2-oxohepta-3-ene-1,7-dioic acid hydratase in catechol pathway